MEAPYDARVFCQLQNGVQARQDLSKMKSGLSDLGAVIARHRLHDVVGVSLLHKHFGLQHNELLIRERKGRCYRVAPRCVQRPDLLAPYLWKLARDEISGEVLWHPLEFVLDDTRDELSTLAQRVRREGDFLASLAARVLELEATEVFGMYLLSHELRSLAQDEFLLETTDPDSRESVSFVSSPADLRAQAANETLWVFQPGEQHCSEATERLSFWQFFAR